MTVEELTKLYDIYQRLRRWETNLIRLRSLPDSRIVDQGFAIQGISAYHPTIQLHLDREEIYPLIEKRIRECKRELMDMGVKL